MLKGLGRVPFGTKPSFGRPGGTSAAGPTGVPPEPPSREAGASAPAPVPAPAPAPPPDPVHRGPEPAREPDPGQEKFETLKRHIHTRLVDRLDMNRISEIDPKLLRNEIRGRRRAPLRHGEPPAQSQRAPAARQRDPRRDLRLRAARIASEGR